MMLICSFILFEQLDSAGSYSTLFRSIDIGVEKANAICMCRLWTLTAGHSPGAL